jgi:two-component system, OmpR family, sensor histidine kinase TctE
MQPRSPGPGRAVVRRRENAPSSMTRPKEQRSLFGEILDLMLAPLLLLWPMSLGLTGLVAQEVSNRPYDRELGELARLLARQVVIEAPAIPGRPPTIRIAGTQALEVLRLDDADRIYLQVLGARGELIVGDRDLPLPDDSTPPPTTEPRYRDAQMRDEPVRVAYLVVPLARDMSGSAVLVQFAETLDKRSRLATEIIKTVILPQFIVLPIAMLLVWLALSHGIRPLQLLQQRIRQREAGDLSPIDQSEAPEEVAPLVMAINSVLARLEQSIKTQKQFLADAAHQLKTPLAGLRMQAEIALREIDAGERDPRALRTPSTSCSRWHAPKTTSRPCGRSSSTWRRSCRRPCATSCHARSTGASTSATKGRSKAARHASPARRCCSANWCATWSTTPSSTRLWAAR